MRPRRWSILRLGCPCPRQQPTRDNPAPQASPPRQTRQPTPATPPEDTPSTHAASPRRERRRGAAAAWPGEPGLGFPPALDQGMDMAMTTPPGRRRHPQASSLPAATAAHGFLLAMFIKSPEHSKLGRGEQSFHLGPSPWRGKSHAAAVEPQISWLPPHTAQISHHRAALPHGFPGPPPRLPL